MTTAETPGWLDAVNWNDDGLVAAVAQDAESGKILTLAWMNRDALALTVERGEAVYWSRSRGRLWHKGEESGHTQKITGVYLDCDNDAIVLQVMQTGGIACHTGRQSCFFRQLKDGQWTAVEPVLKDPAAIYGQDD